MSDFEDPATATPMPYNDLSGSLLLFDVLSFEDNVPTKFSEPGEKSPAIRADVLVIDGPQAGTRLTEVLVFPKMLQAQLRPRVGKKVLGRLGQGAAQAGKNPPWELNPATMEDRSKAEALLARTAASPAPASGITPSTGQPPF